MNLSDLHIHLMALLQDDISGGNLTLGWTDDGVRYRYEDRAYAIQYAINELVRKEPTLQVAFGDTRVYSTFDFISPSYFSQNASQTPAPLSFLKATSATVVMTSTGGSNYSGPAKLEESDEPGLFLLSQNTAILGGLSIPVVYVKPDRIVAVFPSGIGTVPVLTVTLKVVAVPTYGLPLMSDVAVPIDGSYVGELVALAQNFLMQKVRSTV